MKKKLISLALVGTMAASVFAGSAISASALGEYVPTAGLSTNRIYFALPGAWLNEETEKVGNYPGVYWFSGADQPDNVAEDGHGWPGYLTKKAEEDGVTNLFYIDIPEGNGSEDFDVTMLVWSNYLDGGTDKTLPVYLKATQSADFGCQYYSKGDSDLYDDEFFAYVYLKTFESLGYDYYDLDPKSDTFWEDINRAAAEELGEDYDSLDPKFQQYLIYDLFDAEEDDIDLSDVFGDYADNFFNDNAATGMGYGMSFTFDNMVYVVDLDPAHISTNYEGKPVYVGDVFFYYGGGEYGKYPTKEINEEMNGVGGNFMGDEYLNSKAPEITLPDDPANPTKPSPTNPDGTPADGSGIPGANNNDASSSTSDTANDSNSGNNANGAIATGQASAAIIMLVVLMSGVGAVYFTRKRTQK